VHTQHRFAGYEIEPYQSRLISSALVIKLAPWPARAIVNVFRKSPMRILQIAPLYECVPPKLCGGTERMVSFLTEELVRQGHQVTLVASEDFRTSAKLMPCEMALHLNPEVPNALPYHMMMLDAEGSINSTFCTSTSTCFTRHVLHPLKENDKPAASCPQPSSGGSPKRLPPQQSTALQVSE
jgi:hypothetical protein